MTETIHETRDLTHVGLGLIGTIASDLEQLVAYLKDDRLTFDADAINSLTWAANACADLELGRLYRGVTVFNLDGTNDIYVGFAAGLGKSGKSQFTISPRGYLTLPILTGHVSVGGAGTGTAVVIGWQHAPAIGGGKF